MIVTVFRSRLKPGLREEYVALANRMKELARTMPGYISHKDYYSDDRERVAIVEFAHAEASAPGRPIPNIGRRRNWRARNTISTTTFRCARSTVSRNGSCPSKQRRIIDQALNEWS
jgi:heme-degrading monooxygenase HmoA